eukprot:10511481-Alexandrium_andersonii.AAC.1
MARAGEGHLRPPLAEALACSRPAPLRARPAVRTRAAVSLVSGSLAGEPCASSHSGTRASSVAVSWVGGPPQT